MPKQTNNNSPSIEAQNETKPRSAKEWVNIFTTLITVLGSVGVAFITSKATSKSAVNEGLKNAKPIHLESGKFELDPIVAKQYNLDEPPAGLNPNFTPRLFQKHIDFSKEFDFIPVVYTSLSALDVGNQSNTRIAVWPVNMTTKGFDLKIQTWSDARLYYTEVNWIAYEQ